MQNFGVVFFGQIELYPRLQRGRQWYECSKMNCWSSADSPLILVEDGREHRAMSW